MPLCEPLDSIQAGLSRIEYCRKKRQFTPTIIAIALSSWTAYHRRLYLVLTIPLNQYDTFVRKIDPSSQESHVLLTGVFERQTKSDHFERVYEDHVHGFRGSNAPRCRNPDLPRHCPRNRQIRRSRDRSVDFHLLDDHFFFESAAILFGS